MVPNTAYAILGLLGSEESSGYDIKRIADRTIHYYFWSPAPSQIYSELKRLKSLGYVTERKILQENRPNKTLYRVTDNGSNALQNWLNNVQVTPDVLKSSFLLKLFLGSHTSKEILLAQLESRFTQMEERLEEYARTAVVIENREDSLFHHLTLTSGLAHVRAEIEWIGSAIDLIRNSSNPTNQHRDL